MHHACRYFLFRLKNKVKASHRITLLTVIAFEPFDNTVNFSTTLLKIPTFGMQFFRRNADIAGGIAKFCRW